MMRRRILAVLALAVFTAGIAALTRVRYTPHQQGSVLRLSWRVRGEEEERCRRATAAELANVPAHMRQEVVCDERRVAPYRIQAWVDGRAIVNEQARGSGVPGDRPMYLLRDLPVSSGMHRIAVTLERVGVTRDNTADDADDALQSRERRRMAIPPRLSIDTSIRVAPNAIVLVTYDADERKLVVLTPAANRSPKSNGES